MATDLLYSRISVAWRYTVAIPLIRTLMRRLHSFKATFIASFTARREEIQRFRDGEGYEEFIRVTTAEISA